jgi:3-dehydroquinate synthase
VRTKAAHVAGDPLDLAGRRALLNLGHTVAHALEAASGYGTMLHGEAVSVGLVVALQVALKRGLIEEELCAATRGALSAFGLPLAVPAELRPSDVVARTRSDKKRAGARRRMVLPLFEVPDAELEAALRESRR